jgi:capsular polysaccharide biosynthesis protein
MDHSVKEIGKGNLNMRYVMTISKNPKIDLLHYWYILWRKKWVVFLPSFILTIASVVYALLFIRPIFEAYAVIQIESKTILEPSVQAVTGRSRNVDQRKLVGKILRTDYLLQLAKQLDLYKSSEIIKLANSYRNSGSWVSNEEAVERAIVYYLRKKLNLKINPSGEQFQISVRDKSPQAAFDMVNTMTQFFVDESRNNDLKGIRDLKAFTDEQLQLYKQKVEESERKLRNFKESLANNRAVNAVANTGTILKLQEASNSTENSLQKREKKLAELKQSLPQVQLSIFNDNPELLQIKAKIDSRFDEFEKQLNTTGWKEDYDIIMNNDLNLLRQEYHQTIKKAFAQNSSVLTDEEQNSLISYQLGLLDRSILQQRLGIIRSVLDRFIRLMQEVPTHDLQLDRLVDDLEQNRRVYKLFLEQSRGSQIEEAMQNSDTESKYQVVEKAQLPVYAVAGSKKSFVIKIFLLSLVIGFGLVFGLDYFDPSIRSLEDVEVALDLPVIATIPKILNPFQLQNKTRASMKQKFTGQQERTEEKPPIKIQSQSKPAVETHLPSLQKLTIEKVQTQSESSAKKPGRIQAKPMANVRPIVTTKQRDEIGKEQQSRMSFEHQKRSAMSQSRFLSQRQSEVKQPPRIQIQAIPRAKRREIMLAQRQQEIGKKPPLKTREKSDPIIFAALPDEILMDL